MTYSEQMQTLETQGLTTSDAQAVIDAELKKAAAYEVKMEKTKNGWRARSEFQIGTAPASGSDGECPRFLRLETDKGYRGGVESSVRGFKRTGHFEVSAMMIGGTGGGDFSKTVTRHDVRVTEKAVREAHVAALRQFDALIEEAKAYYAAQDQKKEA